MQPPRPASVRPSIREPPVKREKPFSGAGRCIAPYECRHAAALRARRLTFWEEAAHRPAAVWMAGSLAPDRVRGSLRSPRVTCRSAATSWSRRPRCQTASSLTAPTPTPPTRKAGRGGPTPITPRCRIPREWRNPARGREGARQRAAGPRGAARRRGGAAARWCVACLLRSRRADADATERHGTCSNASRRAGLSAWAPAWSLASATAWAPASATAWPAAWPTASAPAWAPAWPTASATAWAPLGGVLFHACLDSRFPARLS